MTALHEYSILHAAAGLMPQYELYIFVGQVFNKCDGPDREFTVSGDMWGCGSSNAVTEHMHKSV